MAGIGTPRSGRRKPRRDCATPAPNERPRGRLRPPECRRRVDVSCAGRPVWSKQMRMRTIKVGFLAFAAAAVAVAASGADRTATPKPAPTSRVRLGAVDLSVPVPADLRLPEGKSRWDLTETVTRTSFVRSLLETDDGIELQDAAEAPPDGSSSTLDSRATPSRNALYTDDARPGDVLNSDGARRWLFPGRFSGMLRPG